LKNINWFLIFWIRNFYDQESNSLQVEKNQNKYKFGIQSFSSKINASILKSKISYHSWVKWLRMQGHRQPATLEVTGSNPGSGKINFNLKKPWDS
jgi:hypothetical protein